MKNKKRIHAIAIIAAICLFALSTNGAIAAISEDEVVSSETPSAVETTTSAMNGVSSLGDWGEPDSSDRNWTILIYMDGDNDLEKFALANMKEIEKAMSSDSKIDIIVLFDRAKGHDASMGDWTETRAYHAKPSVRDDDIDSELLHNCGELNMGDPETLFAFISAGLAKYPAPHVALVMWDHGGGWISMADDEDAPGTESGRDSLSLAEFQSVLEHSAPLFPDGKLDLLYFDMCLMGQAEVVVACAPFVKYMVAGAPMIPGAGMDYLAAIPLFNSTDAKQIAKDMVKVGCEGFLKSSYRTSSLTAFDLSKADAFTEAYKNMAEKLSERIPDTWSDVTRTLFFTLNYMGRGDFARAGRSVSSIDLLDWLSRLKKNVINPPLKEIASLEAATKNLIMLTEKGSEVPFCNGLSFYSPLREANLRANYDETDFNKKTGWLSVLEKLYEAQNKDGIEPPQVVSIEIGVPSVKENRDESAPLSGADMIITPTDSVVPLSGKQEGGSWVKIAVEGNNILWGYSAIAMSDTTDPNSDYTLCLISVLMDENLDLDVTEKKQIEAADVSDAMTPVFKDGRTELAYMVGGLTHRFSNGEGSVLVTAEYTNVSDMKHVTVEGTYTDSQTSEVPVTVSVNTDFYTIESVTAIPENGSAYVISPNPDGVFRPLLKKANGDELKTVPGEGILWKDGLYVIMEPIPEGRHMKIAAMAESIGGNGGMLISRPVLVNANPNIAAHLETTHREGLNTSRILGRFAVLTGVPRGDNGLYIMAPMGSFVDIKVGAFPSGREGLVAVQGILGEMEITTYLSWQMEGLPFVSRYIHDEETGKLELVERNFTLLAVEGDSHYWLMNDSGNFMSINLLPLNNPIFSPEILVGTWDGEDGSGLSFENGQGSYFPPEATRRGVSGPYTVTDNMAVITPGGNQQSMTLFYVLGDEDTLVVTYKDSLSAMVYNRRQTAPPVITPPLPPTPPPLPPIPPQPQYQLEGVWDGVAYGQQIVMQFQGNQYQSSANGNVFEAGTFQLQGNTLFGQTNMGKAFSNPIQWGVNGMSFTMTDTKGMTVVFQRRQAAPPPPPQQVNLSGTWGAIISGQQAMLQIQGNQYQTWISGQLAEAGTFQTQGNVMYMQTNTGATYSQSFQMSPNGMMLTLTMQNGVVISLQRMQ